MNSIQLKKTKTFKSLSKFQQLLILKKSSIESIRLGLKMSELKSLDFWIKTCKPREITKKIVEELL